MYYSNPSLLVIQPLQKASKLNQLIFFQPFTEPFSERSKSNREVLFKDQNNVGLKTLVSNSKNK